jgi:putative transposase
MAAIWQRRFWEHQIRDELDMERHVDYIHFNPVKHGFVAAASGWPYSTFERFVRAGIYAADWGGNPACDGMEFE